MYSLARPDFDILFLVPDLPPLIFSRLDPSSLGLAACVCRGWRDTARKVRGNNNQRFRLILTDLVAHAPLLAWIAANLNEKQLPATLRSKMCALAAKRGALAALQWAQGYGCEWDELACVWAAEGGNLAVLQWAKKNAYPLGRNVCAIAALNGHLEVLQWARKNGCDWDRWTCTNAAEGGHLVVLRWARENGCAWNKADCLIVTTNHGNKEVAAWIASQPE